MLCGCDTIMLSIICGRQPMQAQAAVMPERHGRWRIDTLEVAEPGPQEVLVRVVASGICQTDVHARDGSFRSHIRPCSGMRRWRG